METHTSIGVSNRHFHLTKELYEKLFAEPLTIRNNLKQVGEFASNQTVTIKGPKGEIPNVRVMGPFREYNQIEISTSDTYKLGVYPPVRKSADLKDSADITVIGPKKTIILESSCIIPNRHLHLSIEEAKALKLQDDELVHVQVEGPKGGIMDAFVKISANGVKELHLDIDDAAAFLLKQGDIVKIYK